MNTRHQNGAGSSEWDRYLAKVANYVAAKGKLPPVTHIDDQGYLLGRWVDNQIKAKDAGKLSPEQIERLADAGVLERETDWTATLEAVKAYRRTHGEFPPPNHVDRAGTDLAAWLAWQRNEWQADVLTVGKVIALASLGATAEGKPRDGDAWDASMKAVAEFRRVHGSNPPAGALSGGGADLAEWIAGQCAIARSALLSFDRLMRLTREGWPPSPAPEWSNMLEKLSRFRRRRGRNPDPADDTELAAWIAAQEAAVSLAGLSPRQIELLRDNGVAIPAPSPRPAATASRKPSVSSEPPAPVLADGELVFDEVELVRDGAIRERLPSDPSGTVLKGYVIRVRGIASGFVCPAAGGKMEISAPLLQSVSTKHRNFASAAAMVAALVLRRLRYPAPEQAPELPTEPASPDPLPPVLDLVAEAADVGDGTKSGEADDVEAEKPKPKHLRREVAFAVHYLATALERAELPSLGRRGSRGYYDTAEELLYSWRNVHQDLREVVSECADRPVSKPRLVLSEGMRAYDVLVIWMPGRENGSSDVKDELASEWRQLGARGWWKRILEMKHLSQLCQFDPDELDQDELVLHVLSCHLLDCILKDIRAWLSAVADVQQDEMIEFVERDANDIGLGHLFRGTVPVSFRQTSRHERHVASVQEVLKTASEAFARSPEDLAHLFAGKTDKEAAQLLFKRLPTPGQKTRAGKLRETLTDAVRVGLIHAPEPAAPPPKASPPVSAPENPPPRPASVPVPRPPVTAAPPSRPATPPKDPAPAPDYSGLNAYDAPADELRGFPDVAALVAAVNAVVIDDGDQVPRSEYPTREGAWLRFLRRYGEEIEAAAEARRSA